MTMQSYTDEQVIQRIECICTPTTGDMLRSLLAERQRLQAEVKEQAEQMEAEAIVTSAYFDRIAELEAEVGVKDAAVRSCKALLDSLVEFDGVVDGELFNQAYEAIDAARATPNETKEAKS